MEVHDRIKQRRKELGLSAEEVAAALGVSRATIYRYESAEIEKMPITILSPLAKVLQCSPGYLMGWEDEPQPEGFNPDHIVTNPKGTGAKWLPDNIDEQHLLTVFRDLNKHDKAVIIARAEELRELDAFRRGVNLRKDC